MQAPSGADRSTGTVILINKNLAIARPCVPVPCNHKATIAQCKYLWPCIQIGVRSVAQFDGRADCNAEAVESLYEDVVVFARGICVPSDYLITARQFGQLHATIFPVA